MTERIVLDIEAELKSQIVNRAKSQNLSTKSYLTNLVLKDFEKDSHSLSRFSNQEQNISEAIAFLDMVNNSPNFQHHANDNEKICLQKARELLCQ